MTAVRENVLHLIARMSTRYPEWRLGQLVANVALWARQPTEPNDTAIWDVEDAELLAAMERHLSHAEEHAAH
jgi:hypothetical protein